MRRNDRRAGCAENKTRATCSNDFSRYSAATEVATTESPFTIHYFVLHYSLFLIHYFAVERLMKRPVVRDAGKTVGLGKLPGLLNAVPVLYERRNDRR